jgi:hypothetical protein
MVARDPDDRPDLKALAPTALKGLRRLRGVRPPPVATHLKMSLRAFEHFENGKGRLNVDRIHAFAALLNVDPFAILAAFEIGSPAFALRCADNKMMMIFMMALQEFDANAQDAISHLDPLTLMDSFTKLFEELATKAQEQERLVASWNGGKVTDEPGPDPGPDPDALPPKEDPEPEPE